MSPSPALSHPIRLARLARNRAHAVRLVPDAGALEALADALGLSALRRVRLDGELRPVEGGWALDARLGATVVQPCRVTTDPVTTRIDEAVERRWLAGVAPPEADEDGEAFMPDDGVEALPETLDLGVVLEEALDLALPPFPRAEGAREVDLAAAPPGAAPLAEEARRPFAGLAALRSRLEGDEDGGRG